MEITDRLSILRGGKFMGVYETKDVTPEKISRLMVGRDVVLQVQKDAAKPTEEILRVRDLHYVNDWGKKDARMAYLYPFVKEKFLVLRVLKVMVKRNLLICCLV